MPLDHRRFYNRIVCSLVIALAIVHFNKNISTEAYDLYLEGFFNKLERAGSDSDKRGVPNLPFMTDTYRYADAKSSAKFADSTSPHFPIYNGALANTTDRFQYYIDYMANAAEQGIAGPDDGDARREDALFALRSRSDYANLTAPTKTFTVYASVKWNPSGFAIQEGEYYNISVFGDDKGYGSQFWEDGALRLDAEGYSSYYDAISNCFVGLGRCRGYLKRKRRLLTANWMSLACTVGEFVRPLSSVEVGNEQAMTWLPLDEATLQEQVFYVGKTLLFRAVNTGQLICFANDAHSNYWNNGGSLEVTATRVSWKTDENSEFYYQQLYLPACDSAIAVYSNLGYVVNNGYNYSDFDLMKGMTCNPNGGGSGWRSENIFTSSDTYSSGISDELLNSQTTQSH